MNDPHASLLPDGLRDGLPPDAGHEAAVVARLLHSFAAFGYERVEPPLVEFETSLLADGSEAVALATFRLMDPVSQRMMGLRADMTPSVARIATTRLRNEPRPLRLAYAGPVLRVRGNQLEPDRQLVQVGVELLGSDETAAHVEIILLAYESLSVLGIRRLSVDINLPTLVSTVCRVLGVDDATARRFRAALDRKDAAGVAAIGGEAGRILNGLLSAAGPAQAAIDALDALSLPPEAVAERQRLKEIVAELATAAPGLTVTVDPVEYRGFEYQTGISFTLFAQGLRTELGRGGRYAAGPEAEPATGFTLYMNSLMHAVPVPEPVQRIYIPFATPRSLSQRLRDEGWITVAALAPDADARQTARRLGCSHLLDDGETIAVPAWTEAE